MIDKENFINKNCKDCKEKCDKGIYECEDFIRCIDRMITLNKEIE